MHWMPRLSAADPLPYEAQAFSSSRCCPRAALEHLRVREFQNLKQFRAKAPCRWRSLEITSGALDVRTLAHLPLHSLTEVR